LNRSIRAFLISIGDLIVVIRRHPDPDGIVAEPNQWVDKRDMSSVCKEGCAPVCTEKTRRRVVSGGQSVSLQS